MAFKVNRIGFMKKVYTQDVYGRWYKRQSDAYYKHRMLANSIESFDAQKYVLECGLNPDELIGNIASVKPKVFKELKKYSK